MIDAGPGLTGPTPTFHLALETGSVLDFTGSGDHDRTLRSLYLSIRDRMGVTGRGADLTPKYEVYLGNPG